MNDILKTVLSLSLSGSLLMVTIFLMKSMLKNRVSRRWQYYVWLIVIARLLLPFGPEASPVSLLFQNMEHQTAETRKLFAPEEVTAPLPEKQSGRAEESIGNAQTFPYPWGGMTESEMDPVLEEEGEHGPGGVFHRQSGVWILSFLWIGTAMAVLIRKITIYQSFVQYVRVGKREVSDPVLLDRLARIGEDTGMKRPVELWTNPLVSTPMLLGFFHPCIVLPRTDLAESDFEYTLQHELIHCRRGDMYYKWLVQLTMCVHWFNPLVWLMGREISRDCELACDEAVIAGLDMDGRRAYGDALLRAAKGSGDYGSPLASVMLGEGGKNMKDRLSAIMKYKNSSKAVTLFTLVLTVLLVLGAHKAGAYAGTKEQTGQAESFLLRDVLGEIPEKGSSLASTGRKSDIRNERSSSGQTLTAKEYRPSGFLYSQQGYFKRPYVFEIGWNLWEESAIHYDRVNISLSSGYTMDAYFMEACKNDLEDKNVMASLTGILTELWEETKDSGYPLIRPLVVSVRYIGDIEAEILADGFYGEGALPQFQAVFPELDEKTQKEYLERIYEDGKIAFFAAAIDRLEVEHSFLDHFAEKSYLEGKVNFFSVLAGSMSEDTVKRWLDRAVKDEKGNMQFILAEAGSRDEGALSAPPAWQEEEGAQSVRETKDWKEEDLPAGKGSEQ